MATVLSAQLIRALAARYRVSYQKIRHIFSYYPTFVWGGEEGRDREEKTGGKEKELWSPSLEK